MRFSRLAAATGASVAVLAALTAVPAFAQEEEDSSVAVDAVVIRAQKRDQRLQDVPIVVTVASEQALQDAGVHDIKELTILTPGLTVTSTSNESVTTARIRGVGTVGDNPGLESSVGVVIDGVYRPRNGVGFSDLGKIDQIEVIKGPQGTVFGKNTSAGVINIQTREPSFTPEVEGEFTGGNYSASGASLWISGPLAENQVAGSLFIVGREREGFTKVENGAGPRTNRKDNDQDFYSLRGQIALAPNDVLQARFIADYTKRDENCCVGTQLYVGQQAGNPALTLDDPARARSRGFHIDDISPGQLIDTTNTPFDRRAYANRDATQEIEDMGVSAQFDLSLANDMKFTSITAVRQWTLVSGQDSDFTAADLLYRPADGTNGNQFNQFSQELRLAGQTDRVNWMVGAFYAAEDLDSRQVLLYGSQFYNYLATRVGGGFPALIGLTPANSFQPGAGQRDLHTQDDRSYALFTNNDFQLNDKLTTTVGLRFTKDRKDVRSTYTTTGSTCDQAEAAYPGIVAALAAPGRVSDPTSVPLREAVATQIVRGLCSNLTNNDFDALSAGGPLIQYSSEDNVSGTVKLAYRWNNDFMAYGSYSRGYKSGGFNLDRAGVIIPPAAALTAPNFTASANTYFKPETVDSYELGVKTDPLDNRLLLNATLFHQTYENFQLNTFIGTQFVVETLPEVVSKGVDVDVVYLTPVEGLSLRGGVTYAETDVSRFTAADLVNPANFANLSRLSGERLSFAPEISLSLAVSYETTMAGDYKLRTNVSARHLSDYNTGSDLHPSKAQDAYTLVNARIGIGARDDKWTVELWSQNLTDEDYLQVGFNGPYQVDDSATGDPLSVYDAFLGAPRTFGVTLRGKL